MKSKNNLLLLYFPLFFCYLEVVFHLYMRLSLDYWITILLFSISFGCLFEFIVNIVSKKHQFVWRVVLSLAVCTLYGIEMVCKKILSQYYQIYSSMHMVVDNHLSDYSAAIFKGIITNLHGILMLLLPVILLIVFRKKLSFKRAKAAFIVIIAGCAVAFYLFGFASMDMKQGRIDLKQIYESDENIEEQVEGLGVINMLRLDVRHSLFGVKRDTSLNEDDLDKVSSISSSSSVESLEPSTSEIDESSETEESTEVIVEPVIDRSPNVLNIDFSDISSRNGGDDVAWLNNYIQKMTPTNKNEYTGMFEGYNVVFITAEGLSGYSISEELTPTLYRLTHTGFVFNNFYTPLHYTSTTNGECQNLLGLYPKNGEPKTMTYVGEHQTYLPFTLAHELNDIGYTSIGYHFNRDMYSRRLSHPVLGYEWKDADQLEMELTESGRNVWPQSDKWMIEKTIDEYIDNQPFNIYYMTISGHMPFENGSNTISSRNRSLVADLPYSDTTKNYIATTIELDRGLEYLVNKLEEKGIADKTVIVLAPDHIPYFNVENLEEITGVHYGSSDDVEYLNESHLNFDVYRNCLIMWSASMEEPVVVDKVCGQVDILPTLLNLLGLPYDSRMIEGTDILSESQGLVVFSSRSWKSDKGLYNVYDGSFTLNDGVEMTQDEINEYVSAMNTFVKYKMQMTVFLMETNYYELAFPDHKLN